MSKAIKDEPKYYFEKANKPNQKEKDARKKRRQELSRKRKGLR